MTLIASIIIQNSACYSKQLVPQEEALLFCSTNLRYYKAVFHKLFKLKYVLLDSQTKFYYNWWCFPRKLTLAKG